MSTSNYHPIFCALPPHMVENIINQGSLNQAEKAKRTLKLSGQFRGHRQSLADISVKPKSAVGNLQRIVYDAQFTSNLPGILKRSEGDPPNADIHVNEAYDGAGATYDLYYKIFERNSIDNAGMPIISSVHYQQGYDNAFWDGDQMVYGDGDEDLPEAERLFNRFTIAIDIIGHELTHGIIQYEANLNYHGQPGALNESFSDVFGSLVKQRVKNQTADQANWIIGEGLFTSNVNGVGIRSMKEPGTAYDDPVLGKDPQPAHMDDYKVMVTDSGGVHVNSGIPNKAFYLAAIEIGGYAWEKAGKIWYITLRDKLTATSDFQEAADKTYEAAGDLFGKNSSEQKAVKKGWEGVGIKIDAGGCNFLARLFNR